MTMEPNDLQRLLGPVLASVSRSFYLSIRLLPKSVRPTVSLAYLLARTSDTVADAPATGSESDIDILSRYREDISAGVLRPQTNNLLKATRTDHPGEQSLLHYAPLTFELLQKLPPDERERVVDVLSKIISGQILDRTRFPDPQRLSFLKNPNELEEYTYLVAGCVGEFWTDIVHLRHAKSPATTERRRQARMFGQALQLINILRDAAADLAIGRCYFPETELQHSNIQADANFIKHPAFLTIHRAWSLKAREWLKCATPYVNATPSYRLRLAAWMPAALGHSTLDLLDAQSTVPMTKVKVSRATVYQQLLAGLVRCL
jgi:farnesyl-diphosphate farnesyltransferase